MEEKMIYTKDYFENMAQKWDEIVKHNKDKIEAILDMIGIKEGSCVLDVGCGTGVLVEYLQKRTGQKGKIFCVDISEKMIEIAKSKYKNFSNVTFINDDVNNLKFKDYFDFIICYSVFPHFEDKRKTLLHLTSMLKKGGYLAIAHSQSRKAINDLHKNLAYPINTHLLPGINYFKLLSSKKLAILKSVDDSDKYVVIFKKI
nr:class I SAM-dependent methyltransferase [Caldicellulosiruptor hydrothermalis]